ncbi:MAG: hypothetical protein NZ480_09710 [Bdellovibrionaceae bacterium]|nr:hypothetical protein [Pseudobdellovibrionaceae bacterium]MDW8190056.1 hypothetical protein [Pseudobdellovibrionaceae bacterium]
MIFDLLSKAKARIKQRSIGNKQIKDSLGKILAWGMLSLPVFSCQQDQAQNALVEAQACLNRMANKEFAVASEKAWECVQKLNGNTSKEANQLRCAAIFVKQGFSSVTKLQRIIDQMKSSKDGSNGGGGDGGQPLLSSLGFLAFSGDDAKHLANLAQENCGRSNSPGLALLASMAAVATILNEVSDSVFTNCSGGSSTACENAVKEVLCSIRGEGAASDKPEQIGQVISSTYEAACRAHGANNPMCDVYRQAVQQGGSQNWEQVGNQVIEHLSGNCP